MPYYLNVVLFRTFFLLFEKPCFLPHYESFGIALLQDWDSVCTSFQPFLCFGKIFMHTFPHSVPAALSGSSLPLLKTFCLFCSRVRHCAECATRTLELILQKSCISLIMQLERPNIESRQTLARNGRKNKPNPKPTNLQRWKFWGSFFFPRIYFKCFSSGGQK